MHFNALVRWTFVKVWSIVLFCNPVCHLVFESNFHLYFDIEVDGHVCFCGVFVQEKLDCSVKRDVEGMGVAEIKYGDSLCFVMHAATGLWLSYQAPDVKSTRLGPLKRRVSHRRTNILTINLLLLTNMLIFIIWFVVLFLEREISVEKCDLHVILH